MWVRHIGERMESFEGVGSVPASFSAGGRARSLPRPRKPSSTSREADGAVRGGSQPSGCGLLAVLGTLALSALSGTLGAVHGVQFGALVVDSRLEPKFRRAFQGAGAHPPTQARLAALQREKTPLGLQWAESPIFRYAEGSPTATAPSARELGWNPEKSVICGDGSLVSPLQALAHEVHHLEVWKYAPATTHLTRVIGDPSFANALERVIVSDLDAPLSEALGLRPRRAGRCWEIRAEHEDPRKLPIAEPSPQPISLNCNPLRATELGHATTAGIGGDAFAQAVVERARAYPVGASKAYRTMLGLTARNAYATFDLLRAECARPDRRGGERSSSIPCRT